MRGICSSQTRGTFFFLALEMRQTQGRFEGLSGANWPKRCLLPLYILDLSNINWTLSAFTQVTTRGPLTRCTTLVAIDGRVRPRPFELTDQPAPFSVPPFEDRLLYACNVLK